MRNPSHSLLLRRLPLIMASVLALTACACHRSEPRTSAFKPASANKPGVIGRTLVRPANSVVFGRGATAQVAMLKWTREGDWKDVAITTPHGGTANALLAVDGYGQRFMTGSRSAGYEIHLVTLDCKRQNIGFMGGKAFSDDAGHIGKPIGQPGFRLAPGEGARLCADRKSVGFKGNAAAAIQHLRDEKGASPDDGMTPPGTRPAPGTAPARPRGAAPTAKPR